MNKISIGENKNIEYIEKNSTSILIEILQNNTTRLQFYINMIILMRKNDFKHDHSIYIHTEKRRRMVGLCTIISITAYNMFNLRVKGMQVIDKLQEIYSFKPDNSFEDFWFPFTTDYSIKRYNIIKDAIKTLIDNM